ncbi:unnamed protein product [Rotaria magnacalcarata]|nr:unnamed protein product [Rotaria magnacalcarata]
MKLVLNHIGHNGYYSCWYCKVSGIHTLNKRQYHFEEVPIMRTVDTYMSESAEAEKTGENIHGHLGTSILHQILDVPLPQSIIMDYMHITLLRHARCVVLQLYASIKPKQRIELDNILRHQRFPHTFNRKMRGIKDTHIKATEMKNLLFYGLLPSFYSYIAIEKVAHITLFICAIRMLHGEKLFGSETGVLAHQLLVAYYKDHTKHYHGLENLVLHLHIHFASRYEKYGSLNYTNCFGQESFLGAFSKNKHGTRHWGDLLMHYFNIDFALQNKNIEHTANNFNMTEGPFDASPKSINIVEKLIMWHEHERGCNQATTCTKIYNRCIINGTMYHSLGYTKRQSTMSYFVKYTNNDHSILFGSIELFFKYKDFNFALINHHINQKLFSDIFSSTSYHSLLSKCINSYYYILQSKASLCHYVPVHHILNLCVVFEKENFIIVTPISRGYEHDEVVPNLKL